MHCKNAAFMRWRVLRLGSILSVLTLFLLVCSLAGVHVCSGVFYSCAKEVSHHEPLIEKKFGIKV